jgi:hypothetical protein
MSVLITTRTQAERAGTSPTMAHSDFAQALSLMSASMGRMINEAHRVNAGASDAQNPDAPTEETLAALKDYYVSVFNFMSMASQSALLGNTHDQFSSTTPDFVVASERYDGAQDAVHATGEGDAIVVAVPAFSASTSLYDIHTIVTSRSHFASGLGEVLTPVVSVGLYDNSGLMPPNVYDEFVTVDFPLDEKAPPQCSEYDCFNWNFALGQWDKTGLYGSARPLFNPLRAQCRVDGCSGECSSPQSLQATIAVVCKLGMAVVGDPYVLASVSGDWVPFFPDNDRLYNLLEGADFRVQGGFAAATKASCQCVWLDEDESVAPRAGNRLAALVFEFNGGAFHVTPSGLYYQEGGEWTLVSEAEWNPAQLAMQGAKAVVTAFNVGEYQSEDISVTWGTIDEIKTFPWGDHVYTHQFKAIIPGSGSLMVLAGVAEDINVMDVFFDAQNDVTLGGLMGVARKDGAVGIASFASEVLSINP